MIQGTDDTYTSESVYSNMNRLSSENKDSTKLSLIGYFSGMREYVFHGRSCCLRTLEGNNFSQKR